MFIPSSLRRAKRYTRYNLLVRLYPVYTWYKPRQAKLSNGYQIPDVTVASFGTRALNTPAGGVGGSSAGRSSFSPAAGAGEAGAGGGAGGVVELISCPDSPPAGLVRTKPRCTLQAHNVAIEEAQHFRKIAVKSAFSKSGSVATVEAKSYAKLPLKTVALQLEDRCFGS